MVEEGSHDTGQDAMFQDAVDALRAGDAAHAKDVLTRLLKADQNNPTYWVWMSAAMETNKERIYCLQTALKLDPENASAKRGLTLLGAIPPDENVQPFPLNRPRSWEEKLLLAHEQPPQKGMPPLVRLALLGLGGVVVVVLVVGGLILTPHNTNSFYRVSNTNTSGPSPTFTLTPTFVNETAQPVTPNAGSLSLASVLGVSYTATPLYVNTPRSPQSQDQYSFALSAYQKGDWASFITNMQQIELLEPTAPDVPYYIGEAYRMQGDFKDAQDAYTVSLRIDPNFAPAYLGLARANLIRDPNTDITQLLGTAIQDDPNYGEAYLERANYYLYHNQPDLALSDLGSAGKRMPHSALVQLGYARAYLAQGNVDKGLAAAQQANQIDLTLLPAYLALGQAYIDNAQYSDAIKPLDTYITYDTTDGSAYALLGKAYEKTGSYQEAVTASTRALSLDPAQRQAFLYRGLSYLELNNISAADNDIHRAIEFFPGSFDASLGLMRVSYAEGHYGDAYLHIGSTSALAQTDQQKALVLYWSGLIQEKRNDPKDAVAAWRSLLAMSSDAMTSQMRDDATQHLAALATATATPKGGIQTATPPQTGATGTPSGTLTLTPASTQTPLPGGTP
ncbi:MAG TPA: tetratricopeptide repeat protein [Anaerolineales bacterium]|nr:tetratricopeptide repeat protein [Anaerolineales bacterium]